MSKQRDDVLIETMDNLLGNDIPSARNGAPKHEHNASHQKSITSASLAEFLKTSAQPL
jgi:hypothetical protein